MNISWVLSDNATLDPTVDISQFKDVGSLWGGWRTWRSFSTDNVVCFDPDKAKDLIQRLFYNQCNLYIPNSVYVLLDRPAGVKVFDGNFNLDIQHHDELVSIHLASSQNEIILLFGFDWSKKEKLTDPLLEHRAHNYRNLIKQVIKDNPTTQWVLIDHPHDIMPELSNLPNLSKDSLVNVLKLLSS